MKHLPYLITAYAVVWVVLFWYLGLLARRLVRLQRDVEGLSKKE